MTNRPRWGLVAFEVVLFGLVGYVIGGWLFVPVMPLTVVAMGVLIAFGRVFASKRWPHAFCPHPLEGQRYLGPEQGGGVYQCERCGRKRWIPS